MDLNELKKRIDEFENKSGFEKTDITKLLEMMQEELDILQHNIDNIALVNHQLADLQILIIQLANRYNTKFDSEIEKWFEKSRKYLK